jgi:hypothetical protein
MTKEDIIKLAIAHSISGLKFDEDGLLRFAKLVAEHEREACATIVDEVIDFWVKAGYPECAEMRESINIVESIRNRGQE